jgi:uncharacterized membrane protein
MFSGKSFNRLPKGDLVDVITQINFYLQHIQSIAQKNHYETSYEIIIKHAIALAKTSSLSITSLSLSTLFSKAELELVIAENNLSFEDFKKNILLFISLS